MIKLLNILKENILVETEVDSLDEKWSEKYKRSINCNNPKGFSQKAHCQGIKKKLREDELIPDEQDNKFENEYTAEKVRVGSDHITFVALDKDYNPDKTKDVTIIDKATNSTHTYKPYELKKSYYRDREIYHTIKPKSKDYFNSKNFKDALKTIFPDNWREKTDEFTAGLRGIYQFSSNDDWSILNYFDTNPYRMGNINTLFLNSGETDPILWLKKFLTDGTNTDLKKMLELQEEAVKRADKIERDVMEMITNNAHFYPKGHISDRYDAVDSVDLDTGITYQIKAAKDVKILADEETAEITGYKVIGDRSRFKDYKNKSKLNKIIYYVPKTKTCYIFDNENYEVISNDEVIHYGELETKP